MTLYYSVLQSALLLKDAKLDEQIRSMHLHMGRTLPRQGGKQRQEEVLYVDAEPDHRPARGLNRQADHIRQLEQQWQMPPSRVPESDSSMMSSFLDDVSRFGPMTSAELSSGEYDTSICVSISCDGKCRKLSGNTHSDSKAYDSSHQMCDISRGQKSRESQRSQSSQKSRDSQRSQSSQKSRSSQKSQSSQKSCDSQRSQECHNNQENQRTRDGEKHRECRKRRQSQESRDTQKYWSRDSCSQSTKTKDYLRIAQENEQRKAAARAARLSRHQQPRKLSVDKKTNMLDFTCVSAIPDVSTVSLRHRSSESTFVRGPLYSTMTYPQNSTPECSTSEISWASSVQSEPDTLESAQGDQSCSCCSEYRWEPTGTTEGRQEPSGLQAPHHTKDCEHYNKYSACDTEFDMTEPCYVNVCEKWQRPGGSPNWSSTATGLEDNSPRGVNVTGASMDTSMVCSDRVLRGVENHIYEDIKDVTLINSPVCPYPSSMRPPCIGKEATPPMSRYHSFVSDPDTFTDGEHDVTIMEKENIDPHRRELLSPQVAFKVKSLRIQEPEKPREKIPKMKELNYSVASSACMTGMFCCGSKSKSRPKKKTVGDKFKYLGKHLQKIGQDKLQIKQLGLV